MQKVFFISLFFYCSIATAQNVGIGTATPVAKLHVADSNVLLSSTQLWYLPMPPGNPPMSGEGVRMMWYPDKGAFRTGAVSSTAWDKDSIGKYSFAAGLDAKAKGQFAVALGVNANSLNFGSVTAGVDNTAIGYAGIAMGYNNISRNTHSISIGNNLITKSYGAVATGSFNDTSDVQPPEWSYQSDERIFQVGNGSPFGRSNALTILRNGNTGIGITQPNAPLQFANTVVNRKIVLYDVNNNDHQYYGLGINSGTLRYQIDATVGAHAFYAGANATTSNLLLIINGNGNTGIGVASPSTKLHVQGTTTSSNLILNGAGNGNANDFLIKASAGGVVAARKGHGALALNYIICTNGTFPTFGSGPAVYNVSIIGEIKLFAGSLAPDGWQFCNGQILNIVGNTALFSILGTQYGGNGSTTFALPDLRGAAPVGFGTPSGGGNGWSIGERTQ